MGAALGGRDVVYIGKHGLGEAVRILDGGGAEHIVLFAFQIDGRIVKGRFPLIEEFHVVYDAALKAEFAPGLFRVGGPFIREGDFQALVQVRQLPQPAAHGIAVEHDILKHGVVGQETHQCAPLTGVAQLFQGRDGMPGDPFFLFRVIIIFKAHGVVGPVQVNIHRQPFGQGVYHAGAHPVQTAGIGVVIIAKFAAGMQAGENYFHARNAQRGMQVHRHAPAIIPHGGGAVLIQRHSHLRGIAAHGLVDGVIHDLPQQMMQPPGARGADIHARPHAYRIQPLQYFNTARVVCLPHARTSILFGSSGRLIRGLKRYPLL